VDKHKAETKYTLCAHVLEYCLNIALSRFRTRFGAAMQCNARQRTAPRDVVRRRRMINKHVD